MSQNDSQQIANSTWNFAHVLRDDGFSSMANTEQITFSLFLKMTDEQKSRCKTGRRSFLPNTTGRACALLGEPLLFFVLDICFRLGETRLKPDG